MRPRTLVAGAVLTASLALVALPGLAGSATPGSWSPEAAAFRELEPGVDLASSSSASTAGGAAMRPVFGDPSAATLDVASPFSDPGPVGRVEPVGRAKVAQPASSVHQEWAPARYSLTGTATFYDNGTTAMRLPRGTVIRVCGAGGCLERVVNDYGPRSTSRIIDLYRPDFFAICGCASWSGTTKVTVYVY
jgi:hypothetical protein